MAELRTTFVRLVPRGDMPRRTIAASYADVDLDAEGNIIGFNLVFASRRHPRTWLSEHPLQTTEPDRPEGGGGS